jgi:Fe(3+) dicitrate transport protein
VGGDTGYDLQDYIAKMQIDSDPQSQIYQSLRVKLGYTEQDANETYLGLTDDDFAIDPNLRYAASANDLFLSEHEQYQASYVIDPGHSWRAEVTAYRNDFWRNWYKVQSVGGTGISSVLEDPDTYATELGYMKGATSPDDAVQIRANNRNYRHGDCADHGHPYSRRRGRPLPAPGWLPDGRRYADPDNRCRGRVADQPG